MRRHTAAQPVRLALLGIAALCLLGGVWILVTGLLARQQVADLSTRLGQVRTLVAEGRVADAQRLARDIPAMADRADRLTSGPAWWLAAQVPYLGEPVDVTREATSVTRQLSSDAVPRLIGVVTRLDPRALRGPGASIRLAPLLAIRPTLHSAAAVVDRAARELDAVSGSTWFGPVNRGRDRLVAQLGQLRGYVDAAARASDVLPTMLGRSAPQRYFVGLQNEAELRGTGGLPGAFAIVTARDGRLTFDRFESDAVLLPPPDDRVPTGLRFGMDYDAAWGGSDPTASYQDSNVSPHFPYAAQIWARMWQKVSGQHVDGVLALDPTTLSYLLSAMGPLTLPGGHAVSASNVVELTQSTEYRLFPTNSSRRRFNVDLLKAVAGRLTHGVGDGAALLRAVSLASQQQRLLAWSAEPRIERKLAQTSYAGAIPTGARPFSGLILNNAAAGKLDYYLTRSLTWTRYGCGPTRSVTVTIQLRNNAPAAGLPSYVTQRLDRDRPKNSQPGDSRLIVDYIATRGAQLTSATLDGRPSTVALARTRGLPMFRMDLELPRGQTRTLVLQLQEPAGTGPVRVWRQPGVSPLDASASSDSCG